jgi:hypothetical protein
MCVFDLDPGPRTGIPSAPRCALDIREVLDNLAGLECLAKTSGSKGLQVYVPLNTTKHTHEHCSEFAQAVAQVLEKHSPKLGDVPMAKYARPGKVFIDWSQNSRHKDDRLRCTPYGATAARRSARRSPGTRSRPPAGGSDLRSRRATSRGGSRSTAISFADTLHLAARSSRSRTGSRPARATGAADHRGGRGSDTLDARRRWVEDPLGWEAMRSPGSGGACVGAGRGLLALRLLTALACGFVLTAANGARRTHERRAVRGSVMRRKLTRRAAEGLHGGRRRCLFARVVRSRTGAYDRERSAELVPRETPRGSARRSGMFAGIGGGVLGGGDADPYIRAGVSDDPVPDAAGGRSRSTEAVLGPGRGRRRGPGPTSRRPGGASTSRPPFVGIHRLRSRDIGPNGDAPSALGTRAFVAKWLPTHKSVPVFERGPSQHRGAVPGRSNRARRRPRVARRQLPGAGVVDTGDSSTLTP